MRAHLTSTVLAIIALGACTHVASQGGLVSPNNVKPIPPHQPIIVARMIGTDKLIMRSEPKFAGAISSLTFRGQEYINSADHGRLMQGAIAYDGLLECLNPTQAGGSRDRGNLGQRSTSKRLEAFVTPQNDFSVTTRMAYWLRPSMLCNGQSGQREAVKNTKRLSDDIYKIAYQFGLNGQPNVAALSIEYQIAATYRSAVVEAVTIYSPPAFNAFHAINPVTMEMREEPTVKSDETASPLILSTRDGAHAIAFLSLQPGATYARFRFPDTNKISLVYRETNGISGSKHYKAVWIIGTRDEVATQVKALMANQ
jgi:hypothetical protein